MDNLQVRISSAPQAARIVDVNFDELRDKAHAAGLAAAEARGHAAGYAEAIAGAAATLEQATEQYQQERTELADKAGTCATELAIEIMRQLLRVEVPAGNYDLEGIVRSVLAQGDTGYGQHVIHLNPVDAEALKDVQFRAGTTVEADTEVRRCDVRIQTPAGVLVRELDTCLRDIRERLLGDLA